MTKNVIDFAIELQTEKIKIRPIRKDDFEHLTQLTSDESLWKYFTADLSDKENLERWIEHALIQTSDQQRLAFTIIDKTQNSLVGSTSFGNISYHDKRVEIGWTWIGKRFQGHGINDQVKYLMLKYCFDTLNFERVEFKTDVLNLAARKALSRIGFKEEGILRSHTLMTHNRRRDTLYYSVLRSEWNALKTRNNWL